MIRSRNNFKMGIILLLSIPMLHVFWTFQFSVGNQVASEFSFVLREKKKKNWPIKCL